MGGRRPSHGGHNILNSKFQDFPGLSMTFLGFSRTSISKYPGHFQDFSRKKSFFKDKIHKFKDIFSFVHRHFEDKNIHDITPAHRSRGKVDQYSCTHKGVLVK